MTPHTCATCARPTAHAPCDADGLPAWRCAVCGTASLDVPRALAEIKARLVEVKALPRPDRAEIAALSATRIRLEGELSARSARHLSQRAEKTLKRAAAALRDVDPDLSREVTALTETP